MPSSSQITHHGAIALGKPPSGAPDRGFPDPTGSDSGPISVRFRTDHFAIVRSRDGIPCRNVHRALDETDRAVHEQHVHAARVVGTGRNHSDGAAAILIDVVVDATGPVGRLGVRIDHGGTITPPLTLPLPLLVGAG